MTAPQKFRAGCYTIEGINSFAVVIYFNYLYFYFRDEFGFDNKHNLALASFIGMIYTVASWQAGKFAARVGYFTALKTGFSIMAAGLLVGAQLHTVTGEILIASFINVGMCLIWPTLEALVSEGAVAADAVGLYNITWAATNALAYFIGGTLIEKLGYRSLFYVPFTLMIVQLVLATWLQKKQLPALPREPGHLNPPPEPGRPTLARANSFKQMAWLANPFAYIAINTLLAVIPGVAAKFHLSPMLAGFACSLWCFIRLGMFVALWLWPGWHYRFRWLATAYALLLVSFISILSAPNVPVLIVAQIFFGGAIGLIYYSSLFYSMDASETKSEHGGIHEAAIGLGNCVGPAVGAASLQFLPQFAASGAIAVSVLLLCGFGGLVAIRKRTL
jgi:MFS family permease